MFDSRVTKDYINAYNKCVPNQTDVLCFVVARIITGVAQRLFLGAPPIFSRCSIIILPMQCRNSCTTHSHCSPMDDRSPQIDNQRNYCWSTHKPPHDRGWCLWVRRAAKARKTPNPKINAIHVDCRAAAHNHNMSSRLRGCALCNHYSVRLFFFALPLSICLLSRTTRKTFLRKACCRRYCFVLLVVLSWDGFSVRCLLQTG